jgi:farnesyl diphosphate synthase
MPNKRFNMMITTASFDIAMISSQDDVEAILDEILPSINGPEARLAEAMRHAVLVGGKRFRPFLVCESAKLFGVDSYSALRVAAAVECVHTYSLVHDDLPCMDNDDLRRGKPTLHRKFDEATAVLAGDALLTIAFEILADTSTHNLEEVRIELVSHLAKAAGACGMIGGQMIDLASEDQSLDIHTITRLQYLKTGLLIIFSCEAGAILGRASKNLYRALHAYAHDLGLAYQIIDDLLDIESNTEIVGKTINKDIEERKATFVSIFGPERAREQARVLSNQAIQNLDLFDEKADLLREAAHFVITRRT